MQKVPGSALNSFDLVNNIGLWFKHEILLCYVMLCSGFYSKSCFRFSAGVQILILPCFLVNHSCLNSGSQVIYYFLIRPGLVMKNLLPSAYFECYFCCSSKQQSHRILDVIWRTGAENDPIILTLR